MIDLVCLVADKNIEATIKSVLDRPEAIGIRKIQYEIIVHPNRDPGCFHQPKNLLTGYRNRTEHALIIFDRRWEGSPTGTGADLEDLVEGSLRESGLEPWARAVVIDPELEVWLFSDSPHVASTLGWKDSAKKLRGTLETQGLWLPDQAKPNDPKTAVEWLLRRIRKPRSSSIYRELARRVSLGRCRDRSFLRLRSLLQGWFGAGSPEE